MTIVVVVVDNFMLKIFIKLIDNFFLLNQFSTSNSLDKINEVNMNRNRNEIMTDGYSKSNQQVQHYLQTVSGQLKELSINQIDHSYSKPWNSYPDRENRSQPTKYLFMKYFPKHLQTNNNEDENDEIDVVSVEEMKKIPFLTPKVS